MPVSTAHPRGAGPPRQRDVTDPAMGDGSLLHGSVGGDEAGIE